MWIPHSRLPLVKLYGISSFHQKYHPLAQKTTSKFSETNDGFEFSIPYYLWLHFMKYRPFIKNTLLWPKIFISKFWEVDDGFGFPIRDYLWSHFMKYRPFVKNTLLWRKKSLQNFEKLMMDLNSPSPITFG